MSLQGTEKKPQKKQLSNRDFTHFFSQQKKQTLQSLPFSKNQMTTPFEN